MKEFVVWIKHDAGFGAIRINAEEYSTLADGTVLFKVRDAVVARFSQTNLIGLADRSNLATTNP